MVLSLFLECEEPSYLYEGLCWFQEPGSTQFTWLAFFLISLPVSSLFLSEAGLCHVSFAFFRLSIYKCTIVSG